MEDRSSLASVAWLEMADRYRLKLATARSVEEVEHLEEVIDLCEIRAIKAFIAPQRDEEDPDLFPESDGDRHADPPPTVAAAPLGPNHPAHDDEVALRSDD